ncbi:MAG: hypothetical protein K1X57_17830 [Gemmataceae bacterium]|nr:hypothetical protein [Gemmataceae bacterium]
MCIQMGDGENCFLTIAKRIETVYKGKCLRRLDSFDQHYWDFEIDGATVVLHSDVFAGISLHIENGTRDDLLRRVAASIAEPAAPKSLPYLWLFLGLWLVILLVVWLTGDWTAHYDSGNGPEIKFRLTLVEQLAVCAIIGLIVAAFTTVLARWTRLWSASKPVPMG